MKTLTITTLVALLGSAMAQAEPVTYNVDPTHTFPSFAYSHMGLSGQQSRFNNTSGSVTLDTDAKTANVDITIDMQSVDTGSTKFDEHIQSPDFFDTAKYPTAKFKSTEVTFDGDTPTQIMGDLTIKGVTKPVTLQVTHFKSMPHPMMKKPAIGANASTTIKRSDFNAGKYAPMVSDEVTITIAFEALAK